jgi:hypothetical protein
MTTDAPRPFRDLKPAPSDPGCLLLVGIAALTAAAVAAQLLLRRIRR